MDIGDPKREDFGDEAALKHASGFGFHKSSAADILLAMPEAGRSAQRDPVLPTRLIITSLICDSTIILYAMLASFWLRFCTPLYHYGVKGRVTFHDYSGYIAFGALSLIFMLLYFNLYDRHKLLHLRKVSFVIIKATFAWYIGFLSISLMFKFQPPISRMFVSLAAFTALGGLFVWRWAFHRYLQSSPVAVRLSQRVLFVGWNEDAERLTETFESDAVPLHKTVGCVTSPHARIRRKPTVHILGQYEDIGEIITRHVIDMVILSDVNSVKGEIIGLANLCEREMVQFKVIPNYFQILVSGLHLETVGGIPVLGVSQLPLDRIINIILKRSIDIIGAIVGLVLSVPLVAIFAGLVYMESPGPVLYRQRRLGLNGRPFNILKIRSMKLDAEAHTGARWAQKDDDRRLKIGAFMREWNIDEVPQFWNVLNGEMSLVGPRPERPELIENFKQDVPHYNARHNVKPGITGWAQVKGLRGNTDLGERIRADLFYLENWNVLLDFQIMVMTFLRRDNAY